MTNDSMLDLLKTRRSPKLRTLAEPGPTGARLDELLTIAARVPDHGKLTPWRFILVRGDARAALGESVASALKAKDAAAPEAKVEEVRTRFASVPLTVVVVSSPKEHPAIPRFEQELSAGALCMNLIIAAKAMGYGAVWLTDWFAQNEAVRAALKVGAHERIAGFIYIGTCGEPREDRPRPVMAEIVSEYGR